MSVTAVPLRPVHKSALWTLWIGLTLLIGIAIGYAMATTGVFDPKVEVETLEAGTGASPSMDDIVLVSYKGMLADGTVFDENEQTPMELAGVVPGFAEAMTQMQQGGKYRAHIPAHLGYGDEEKSDPRTGEVVIPANSDLVFEVTLHEFKTRAEIEELRREMQMMQQQMMQQGGPGAPGAPNPASPPTGGN